MDWDACSTLENKTIRNLIIFSSWIPAQVRMSFVFAEIATLYLKQNKTFQQPKKPHQKKQWKPNHAMIVIPQSVCAIYSLTSLFSLLEIFS